MAGEKCEETGSLPDSTLVWMDNTTASDLDWVSLAWPEERRKRGDYPKVQLYCLMSVKDCYTDL